MVETETEQTNWCGWELHVYNYNCNCYLITVISMCLQLQLLADAMHVAAAAVLVVARKSVCQIADAPTLQMACSAPYTRQ